MERGTSTLKPIGYRWVKNNGVGDEKRCPATKRLASDLSLCLLIAVAGCAASRPTTSYPPTDPASIQVASSLLSGMAYLGPVDGLSCQKGVLNMTPPSAADALEAAKSAAANVGATHLASVEYAGIGLLAGCGLLDGLRVKAIAYRQAS